MDFTDLLTRYGLPLAELIIVLIALAQGVFVPNFVYKDALAQRDRAIDTAERLTNTADVAASIAERIVGRRVQT